MHCKREQEEFFSANEERTIVDKLDVGLLKLWRVVETCPAACCCVIFFRRTVKPQPRVRSACPDCRFLLLLS